MSLKRLVVSLIGLVAALVGLFQWSILWRYDTPARGNIVSLVWLDSGSNLFGIGFAESSALLKVRYVVPSGKAYTFNFTITQAGAAGRPDIAANSTIPLRYDSTTPQNAIAEMDYSKTSTRSALVLLAGAVLFAAGLAAPLLKKKRWET